MNQTDPSIPVPTCERQRKFADFVLEGIAPAKAYKKAGYKASTAASCAAAASRLLKNGNVATYLYAVRQQAAKGKVLSVQAKREFLARVVSTPLMQIDPNAKDRKDGDLITKYKRVISVRGEDETLVTEEFVKLDPLKAIDLDNKLSGDDSESNAVAGLAQALAGLASPGGPVMNETM